MPAGKRAGGAAFGTPRCSLDAAIGGGNYSYGTNMAHTIVCEHALSKLLAQTRNMFFFIEYVPKFPRMNIRDPYKCLGVSHDASEEEIREARNFLLEQYAGHESSVETIEAAYERILFTSFKERKKTKFNLKSRLRKKVVESPPWMKRLLEFVELPPTDVILRRLFFFVFMGAWSVINSAESGPAFQVALSILSCIYFLNDKMKNLVRASATGFGALLVGWAVGSVVVPMIPSVVHPSWTIELLTSLISYVFLFLVCTFLK